MRIASDIIRSQVRMLRRFCFVTVFFFSLVVPAFLAVTGSAQDDKGKQQLLKAQIVAEKLNLNTEQVQRITTQRGISLDTLEFFPASKVPRLVRRLDFPDLPRERIAFRMLQLRNELGIIPQGARWNAMQKMTQMRAELEPNRKVAGLPAGKRVVPKKLLPLTAGVDKTLWEAIGPGNIGGRTRAILVHPNNPDLVFAASVAGGIWRSDDGGNEFYPVDDFLANLVVSCMVMDPTNPDVIYAGTGEGFGNGDALRGAGIFRTKDGGMSWEQLPATSNERFQWVNRLAVSKDGKVLLAATGSKISTETGIYRSEDPDRANWDLTLSQRIGDVKFDPNYGSKAIAGSLIDGIAFYSVDAGNSWKAAKHPDGPWDGRVELAYASKDSSIVYASVDVQGGEIWRSVDGGHSFSRQNTGTSYLGEQGWYGNTIWAGHPTNADFVLVGGVDLWRSSDAGKTLIDISTWWADLQQSAHADHHVIVAHSSFDGAKNTTVFFGNDGGLYKTDDVTTVGNNPKPPRTNGWKAMNNKYGVTMFYSAAGNVQSGVIIGGAQDNGTLRYTAKSGANAWSEMFGGDGGYCASDYTDSRYFYGEYVFLNIHRSMDSGSTSEYISGQYWNGSDWAWKPFPYSIPDAKNQQANFIAPFVLDPNEPNRLLAGGVSLWRTNNARAPNTNTTGPKWASIKSSSAGVPISAITVAKSDSNIIWVGHNNGKIYKTGNGITDNPVWSRLDNNNPPQLPTGRMCTRIVISPKDPKVVFLTFGGFAKKNVWKTEDGGTTWKSLGNALPEVPIRALTIHPKRDSFLYIGTEIGIFASEDDGNTWSPTNEGPTNCSVDDLFWMNATLMAATHGRGLFRITIP